MTENGCPLFEEIHPAVPMNSSSVFVFPNETNSAVLANKTCSWKVFIPDNHFAILYVNATLPFGSSIIVTQSPNHTEKFLDVHVEVALLFVAPSLDISWFSGNSSEGKLDFNVQWQEYPENMTVKDYTLEKNGRSIVLEHEDTYSPVVFRAATKVSIFCLTENQSDEDSYLRSIIVFDGPDLRSPYLGSLYSLRQSRSQLVSNFSTATIFSIVPIPTHHHVIVQDASMYQNISQITGLSIHGSDVETVNMEALSGKSVVFTHIDNVLVDEYLISVELEDGAELQVYFEGLSGTQKVAVYTNSNNRTHLPQKLQGRVRYYVLTAGNATLTLTRDKWNADWEKAFAGRRGFFTSRYWKHDEREQGLQQDSFHFIGKESKNATAYTFSYRVLETDLSADSSLHIVVSDNAQRMHYYDHRSAYEKGDGDKWISHSGHSISVVYSSNYERSSGFLAEFQINFVSPSFAGVTAARLKMFYFFSLLFLFFLIGWSTADIPACNNGASQFDPPANTSEYTWYPNNFTGSLPPLFPNNFNCIYHINVPQGWSATVILTVNMTIPPDRAVSVSVYDQTNQREVVYITTDEHFFFIANGGKIQLNSRDANVQFGFVVKWWQNLLFDPFHKNVTINAPQPTTYWAFSTSPYQIKAETRVSLVVTPPIDDNMLQYLRSIIIYDGADWNSTCLGTALQVYNSNKQIVSSGQYMTVQQLRPYYSTGRTMLIFQDYDNTKDIVQYQGVVCANPIYCGQVTMDGSQGIAAVSTVFEYSLSGAEYITGLSGSGILDVYIGGKTKSKANLIASYDVNNSALVLPQEFLGYVRTYVLTGQSASINLTQNSQDFLNSGAVGRKGFIASRSYKTGQSTYLQDTFDYIRAPYQQNAVVFNYKFTIRAADFVNNATLSVVVTKNGKDTYRQLFNSTNAPSLNNEVSALGDDFTVTYKAYGYPTTGFYLDFELLKSSSHYGLFVVLVISCVLNFV
ncbi:unnamed protein product [Caenorhabditis sp. 36 PRJEB53466]|nr:unnamed protein product [Caenorhabditis sp. 36 PRJEB53466]